MEQKNVQETALTERIESGEYFREARSWYDLVYLSPISQRIFFIVVASFACLFMLFAVISVLNLLPISPRVPFAIYNDKPMQLHPKMTRFKKATEPANPAILRFYLTSYVQKREGYSASRILANRAFILRHSVPDVGARYSKQISQSNPQSPVRRLGKNRNMVVEIRQVQLLEGDETSKQQRAQIDFSTSIIANELLQKTNWTAVIGYEYTGLQVRNTFDEALGDYRLDFDEPTFKVLSYDKRERLNRGR